MIPHIKIKKRRNYKTYVVQRHTHMWQEDREKNKPKFEGWGIHKERRKWVLGV